MGFLSFLGFGRRKNLVDQRLRSLDSRYMDLHRQMRELEQDGPSGQGRSPGGKRRPVPRAVRPGAPPPRGAVRTERPTGGKGSGKRRGVAENEPGHNSRPRKGPRKPATFVVPEEGGPMTIDAEVAIKAIAPPVDLEHQIRTRRVHAFRLCFVAALLAIVAMVLWFGNWSGG